jgi:hypothetical protein
MGRNGGTDHDEAGTTLTRRTLLGSAGLLAGLAGCAGGGDGGDDSASDGDSGPADTEPPATTAASTTQPMESMCQVADNSVEELSVVGCQSEERDGSLVVNIRVRNDGQQETDLFNYDYTVTPYDGTDPSSANNIGSAGQSTLFPGSSVVQPGETTRIRATVGIRDSASLSDLQLYTITVECGNSGDGSYCE